MRIFFSGGSPIPEVSLKKPDIMPSYYVDVGNNKPRSRLRAIIKIRRKAKKK